MELSVVLKRFFGKNRSGQIIIKLEEAEHLLKIYLQEGKVVYATMGRQKGKQLLKAIKDAKVREASFIEGVSPPSTSFEDMTEFFLSITNSTEGDTDKSEVSAEEIERLENAFVEIVGPIGTILIENIFQEMAYKKGEPMDGNAYNLLLSRLLQEIPPDRREDFNSRIS